MEGFKHESQLERFNVTSSVSHSTLSVNLSINSVSLHDEGVLVLKFTMFESDFFFQKTVSKSISVHVPPGRATCYITESEFRLLKNVKCHATCGNGQTDLACYQDRQKLPFKREIVQEDVVVRAVFWMEPYSPVCCCSSDASQNVSYDSCKDFEWAPMIENSTRPSTKKSKLSEDSDMTIPPVESKANGFNQINVFIFFATSFLLQYIVQ